ncbi:hypothetical protein [Streptomyces sp. NPDC048650]|uniref:hypothetical protein n=1 Tax=unclassified Streptomyces TaxID=2593676 RepID=UPI00371AAC6A
MSMTRGGDVGGVFWSWPAVAASMAALLGEALVAGAAAVMYDLTQEPDGPGGIAILLPFMLLVGFALGAVPGFAVTVTLVLPTLWLAGWAHRWGGRTGRPAWWCTAAAAPFSAAGATVLYGMTCALFTWSLFPPTAYLVLWLVLTPAAALAALPAAHAAWLPDAKRALRLTLIVAASGIGAAVGVFLLCAGAFATGLLTEYRAPHLARAAVVGVWTDGSGGTLRLRSGGAVRASGLRGEEICNGTGEWRLATTPTGYAETVEVSGDDCAQEWIVGGTAGAPTLYAFVGDPDDGERRVLTRQGGAGR